MRTQVASRSGYSLIELLVCVAIISILTAISLVYYQGALDQADLKYAAPAMAFRLETLRQEAEKERKTITVDFQLKESKWTVTKRKGTDVEVTEHTVQQVGLIKRPLRFLRYEWPDGETTPAQYVFTANSAPQGGTLHMGTIYAETPVRLVGGRFTTDYGIHHR